MKAGETPAAALARELREELGVAARIGPEVYRTRHKYPQMTEPIELIFFQASLQGAEIQNLAFETMQWRAPATLTELNFLPADRDLIERLAQGVLRIGGLHSGEPQV
jgi:8-oxo-dGTP diphosphatase